MLGRAFPVMLLLSSMLLAACGQSRSPGPSQPSAGPPSTNQTGGSSRSKSFDLRMPLAKSTENGRSLLVAYQIFGRTTPIEEVLIRQTHAEVGVTLRAQLPTGPLVAIAWGFACAEVPLNESIGDRRIVDDSKHRYPGSESGISDEQAKIDGQRLFDAAHCQRVPASR